MMWLTWRQFRWQAVTAAAVLAVLAIALGVTGFGLSTRFDQAGLSACHSACSSLASNFIQDLRGTPYAALFFGCVVLMYLAPALMGIFWGAPLIAREFEAGTHRLAWNQSITRARWSAVKLGLIGLAAVGTAGLLSLMITWWAGPIDHALNLVGGSPSFGGTRISPVVFAARGVAPLGYAVFAFALGVTAGVLIRKTLPAMAITLVIFAAVQFLMPNFVRPHLIPPVQATAPFNANAANEIMISSAPGNSPAPSTDRRGRLQPARCLDAVEQDRHSGRKGLHWAGGHGMHRKLHSGAVRQLAGQPALAPADHLPASKQVLAAPAHRDRDLPGHRGRAWVALRLAGASSARLAHVAFS